MIIVNDYSTKVNFQRIKGRYCAYSAHISKLQAALWVNSAGKGATVTGRAPKTGCLIGTNTGS